MTHRSRVAGTLLLAIGLTACASLPTDYPQPERSVALAADPSTQLGSIEAEFAIEHGPEVSGFEPIDANGDGLWWRLALVDSAERSLDIQYYLWYDNAGGMILLNHVVAAADRGVRVRVLIDDFQFMTDKQGLVDLSVHPQIEIRIFNPWAGKGYAAGPEYLARFDRLNHRMHNKLLVADNQAVIFGGRNVGDHYFGLGEDYNFRDLDVIAIGPAARQLSEIFDHFWNSDGVIPAAAFADDGVWADAADEIGTAMESLASDDRLGRFPIQPRTWEKELEELVDALATGTSSVAFDRVVPGTKVPTQDGFDAFAAVADSAQREIVVMNPYIIPDEDMMAAVRETTARGVAIRILTNSLASQDVPAVNSKYKKYRVPLLQAGVELHELKEDPAIRPTIIDSPPNESEFSALHAKVMVVDRKRLFIGSLNLDPRSIKINTEMGLVISSPGLGEEIARIIERDMEPANSWRVGLDENGELYWESDEGRVSKQPARSGWQRIEAWFLGLAPRDQL